MCHLLVAKGKVRLAVKGKVIMKSWTLDRVMEPVVLVINRVLIGNLERAFSIIGNGKQKKRHVFLECVLPES